MRADSKDKLLKLDIDLTERLTYEAKPGIIRTLSVALAHSGDSWFWILGLGVIWLAGSEFWKWRAVVLFAGIFLTALIVMGIKFTVRRRRPAGDWGAIYRKTDPHSFPSGHAARSAMLAVIALGTGPQWFGILLLIWAPLVMLARVSMGLHYLSDVIAGAILGVLIGLIVLVTQPQISILL
jgi:undecaprenyl-diphosphatase